MARNTITSVRRSSREATRLLLTPMSSSAVADGLGPRTSSAPKGAATHQQRNSAVLRAGLQVRGQTRPTALTEVYCHQLRPGGRRRRAGRSGIATTCPCYTGQAPFRRFPVCRCSREVGVRWLAEGARRSVRVPVDVASVVVVPSGLAHAGLGDAAAQDVGGREDRDVQPGVVSAEAGVACPLPCSTWSLLLISATERRWRNNCPPSQARRSPPGTPARPDQDHQDSRREMGVRQPEPLHPHAPRHLRHQQRQHQLRTPKPQRWTSTELSRSARRARRRSPVRITYERTSSEN